MLRASAITTGLTFDLRGLVDPDVSLGIPASRPLVEFTDALIAGTGVAHARRRLVNAVGKEGAARAALVAANFEMMNRIVDATGVPVPPRMAEIFGDLGLTKSE